jgi:tetratricopeptide (TPR) repeat protein
MISYWNDTSLHGSWVYDDAGSVAKNVVVIGQVPTTEVFKRDFWGTPMNQPASHKSFRPVTTLSFRLNYLLSQLDTYWYHVTNVVLHGIVSGLVTKMSAFVFRGDGGDSFTNVIAQLVTGFLFGLHPIHAEVVSNITSRGEMLMSLFYILAIWSYASATTVQQSQPTTTTATTTITIIWWTFLKLYIFPALCMALSLFSKEQGATALISSVLFDFLTHYSSVVEYMKALFQQKQKQDAIFFFKRTAVLAIQTLLLVGWRIHLNGESSPDFIVDQNPAGFASDRFTRIFSIHWVYCLYIYDIVYPKYLCPDWSGKSIDLIRDWNDVRILAVVLLWIVVGACVVSLVFGVPNNKHNDDDRRRRVVLLAVFACTLSPFLLSSNLLVVVGLMKADRVMYLPLFGFCLLEALLVKSLYETKSRWLRIMTHLLLLLQLGLYGIKVHERNIAWSHSLFLWMSAYEINPRSYHTMYNCGYELSLKQQYELAEKIMRPIASARVDGPSNTFVYAMILFNLGDCEKSLEYVEEALDVIEEKKKMGGPRNAPHQLARTTSNLLVAKAHCVPSVSERGKILYEAVQVDPQNDYAIQQAQGLMERVNLMKQHGLDVD